MTTGLHTSHQFLGDFSSTNKLHNPEFWLAQRSLSATSLTAYSAGSTGADRWRMQASANSVYFQRQASTLDSDKGAATYMGYYEKAGASGYFGITQFQESDDSVALRGQTVTFSIWVRANDATLNNTTYRIALISWSGTADAPDAEITSVWASATPTLKTNFTYVESNTATISNSEWTEISVTGVVPSDCNNLGVFAHTGVSTASAAGSGFLVTGARMYASSQNPFFHPRNRAQELLICQRFYQRIVPSQTNSIFGIGQAVGSSAAWITIIHKTTMRITPTLDIPTISSNFLVTTANGTANTTVASIASQTNSNRDVSNLTIGVGTSNLVAGNATQLQSNSTSVYLGFSAEL